MPDRALGYADSEWKCLAVVYFSPQLRVSDERRQHCLPVVERSLENDRGFFVLFCFLFLLKGRGRGAYSQQRSGSLPQTETTGTKSPLPPLPPRGGGGGGNHFSIMVSSSNTPLCSSLSLFGFVSGAVPTTVQLASRRVLVADLAHIP